MDIKRECRVLVIVVAFVDVNSHPMWSGCERLSRSQARGGIAPCFLFWNI